MLCAARGLGRSRRRVTVLMQDLPLEDAQRVVLTADPAASRRPGRALRPEGPGAGQPPADAAPAQPVGPVRTVSVAWSRRAAALGDLLQLARSRRVTIWAQTGAPRPRSRAPSRSTATSIRLVTGDAPRSSLDHRVRPAHRTSGSRSWSRRATRCCSCRRAPSPTWPRIARPTRPLRLPGLLEEHAASPPGSRARMRPSSSRATVAAAAPALAPLFERHDPTRVAAAL